MYFRFFSNYFYVKVISVVVVQWFKLCAVWLKYVNYRKEWQMTINDMIDVSSLADKGMAISHLGLKP